MREVLCIDREAKRREENLETSTNWLKTSLFD